MIITKAPLRVSFFGGGTDFPEYFKTDSGAVLATAIDKYSYVTTSHFYSRLFNYSVRLSYSKGELVKEVAQLQHPVFRACLQYCGLEKDIELHTVADLPAFTGLGSSSSFTVALLTALHAYKGSYVSPLNVAYQAIHIERNILKENVGLQDQTTAAVGGFNILEFKAEDDIRLTPLNLSRNRIKELQSHLILMFTGITRRASDVEGKKLANFNHVRSNLRRMRKMVDTGFDVLVGGGSLESFGRLLDEGWQAKQEMNGVTNDAINDMYRRGIQAGAWGGKLLGAGGGGFLLFCAPPETHAKIRSEFPEIASVDLGIAAQGVNIVYSG